MISDFLGEVDRPVTWVETRPRSEGVVTANPFDRRTGRTR